jgi:hypothetical protein
MTFGNVSTAAGRLVVTIGLLVLAGCGGSSGSGGSAPITTGTSVLNTAAVTVGFGALGPSGGYVNGIWASVTVCAPGSTTSCQTIPNVLVDTGSTGLRLLSSALTVSLPTIQSTPGNVVQECIQFGDFSYTWGPLALATVQITGTGEMALQVPGQTANSGIPIQLIAANPPYAVPSSCLATPTSPGLAFDDNTLENLGANGILGIGNFPQDCGSYCTTNAADQYYICPSGVCEPTTVPLQQQLWNPVSAFSSSDTNGSLITLPADGSTGAASVSGSLILGIGKQSDNAIGSAKVYEVDQYGNFPQVVYNGIAYTSPNNGSFIDSGSELILISDAASLASTGIIECNSELQGFYCPNAPVPFTVTVYGANSASTPVSFTIANAAALLNSGLAAFNNLGGDSGTGPSTDYVDLGLPFFFGRTVFVGIAGASTTYPNGYWAF